MGHTDTQITQKRNLLNKLLIQDVVYIPSFVVLCLCLRISIRSTCTHSQPAHHYCTSYVPCNDTTGQRADAAKVKVVHTLGKRTGSSEGFSTSFFTFALAES